MMAKILSLKINNKAFSLVELMVVVAIIGVLAAVAVPAYKNYIRKAESAEAKGILSGIFSLEKAYYAEHQVYTSNLLALGLETPNLKYYGLVGFINPSIQVNNIIANRPLFGLTYSSHFASGQIPTYAPSSMPAEITSSPVVQTFAAAALLLENDTDPAKSAWYINEKKILREVIDL